VDGVANFLVTLAIPTEGGVDGVDEESDERVDVFVSEIPQLQPAHI